MCQWIIMCEVLCWNTIKDTCKSWTMQCRDKRPFCQWYRMICSTRSLIRQLLYHFATDFNQVLLQLLGTDIENSLLKYRVSYNQLKVMIKNLNCWWKAVKNLLFYLWIFNLQLHVHLKKWTLKSEELYQLFQ